MSVTARPPLVPGDEHGDDERDGDDCGEPRSFEAFYRSHANWAARLAYLLVGDATAAEDLVQDGFAALNQRWEQVDHPAAYLRTTIVHRRRATGVVNAPRTALQSMLWVDALTDARHRELFDVVGRLPARGCAHHTTQHDPR